MATPFNETAPFFNLMISGIGYLKCIREIPVKAGDNFWSCAITALHGKPQALQYTRFDCKVLGKKAERCIKKLRKADNGNQKILVSFKLGDLKAEIFTYPQGAKKGETGISLKANLVFIAWIKVDGTLVYKAGGKQDKNAEGNLISPVL